MRFTHPLFSVCTAALLSGCSVCRAFSIRSAVPDVVVISPPGGIGEIASLESAKAGSSVKWFVVSASTSNPLSLTADSLAAIKAAGGSLEFAGADAESLVFADEASSNSATAAVASWCSGTKAVLCTYDGAEEEGRRAERSLGDDASVSAEKSKMIRSGVRVAARQAASVASSNASKVIALYSDEEMSIDADGDKQGSNGFLGNLFGGKDNGVPATLKDALEGSVSVVRYGELFGAAESSVSIGSSELPSLRFNSAFNNETLYSQNHLLSSEDRGYHLKFAKCIPCALFV